MKNILFTSLWVLASFVVKGQITENLTCLDFSKGEFKNVDTHNLNSSSLIIRNGNKQLEIINGKEITKKIVWVNDCNYSLFFSKKDAKKDRFAKYINKNGGLSVKMDNISGNTLFYTITYFDGRKTVTTSGSMVKISNDTF